MKEETIQKELFKEFETPKKKRKMHYGMLPKNYIFFKFSYEQIIFVSIALIMLMVLLFSLGIERGKSLATLEVKQPVVIKKADSNLGEIPEPLSKPIAKPAREVAIEPPSEAAFEAPSEAPAAAEKKVTNSKLFTIQAVAYRSKKLAQKELINLGKKGFKPFIIVGGSYYQICVGEYKSRNEADKALSELKKSYKDSFIRKR